MIITKLERREAAAPKRTAAYCRVSTRRESQQESFETQKQYYAAWIQGEPNWIFADIYADRRSGTHAHNRPGFQRMLADAADGKLDLILVKSISRFARNLVDCQIYLDRLSALGVSVYFEKEQICSDDPSASLILKLLAAVAQDESRSISRNVRLAYASRCADGRCRLGNNRLLGYDERNGQLVPNSDAWIVREVFSLFLQGKSYGQIANAIAARGGKTLRGKARLSPGTIRYMLSNEAYIGDRSLQKTPPRKDPSQSPVSPFPPNYLINDHPAIIPRTAWQQAQQLLEARKKHK